jgi:hypothetical protein
MQARLKQLSLVFLLGVSVMVLSAAPARAQMYTQRYGESKFEITPQVSYFYSTDIAYSKADLNISSGAGYGVTLNVKVQRDLQFELFWVGSSTSADLVEYQGPNLPQPTIETFDIAANYFMVGATQMLRGKNIKPFGTFVVGAAWWSPKST